jgi:dihydrofolate reductase
MMTSLIVAASRNEVIGAGGTLPWYLPDDLRRFRRLTRGHAVLVGRLTHEDIVSRLGRPLPGRTSVVLSSAGPKAGAGAAEAAGLGTGLVWVTSLAAGLSAARAAEDAARAAEAAAGDGALAGEIFVIGGTSVYRQALPHVDRIYLTRVHREVAGDTVMPGSWLDGFRLTSQEDRPAQGDESAYSFLDYVRETD